MAPSRAGSALMSATISALVSPSGTVNRCRTVLPLASSSATPPGVIAAANSYSPALSRPDSPVVAMPSRNNQLWEMTPWRLRARVISITPPFGTTIVVVSGRGPGLDQSRQTHSTKLASEAARSRSAGTIRARDGQAIVPALAHAGKDEGGVGAAEAEGVRQHIAHRPLLGAVRHQVDVVARRRVVEVERRRDDAVAQRQDREDRLDAAGGAEKMADRRFGGGHRELVGVLAEQPLHRAELDLVG